MHLVLRVGDGRPLFGDPGLAAEVFGLLERNPETVAACLMPDHLQWVLRDASAMESELRRFKSRSTTVAWSRGHAGRLWQNSYWDHVVRREEDLLAIIAYVMYNPVRAGFVVDPAVYPYVVWRTPV